MTVSSAEITALVGSFVWPFVRIGSLLVAAPVFGSRLVPVRVRIIMALVLSLVIAPLVPDMPQVEALSPLGVLITLQQILIGAATGFALQLVFMTLGMAGEYIAMSMGLGFASMTDPQNGVSVPLVSQFLLILAALVFLSLDGHLTLIQVLAESFATLPVAPLGLSRESLWLLIGWGSHMFQGALRLALPVVTSLLLAYLALGVMTRAAPQLNIFSVGFPITILIGFIGMMLTLPAVLPLFGGLLENGLQLAAGLVKD